VSFGDAGSARAEISRVRARWIRLWAASGPDIEQLGDLRRRPAFGVVEYERDSVGGCEPAQRSSQRQLIFGCGYDSRGVYDVADQEVENLGVGGREISSPAVGSGDGAGEDAPEPPAGCGRIPELMSRSPRPLESVLYGVLGVVLLARQAPRERQQLRQLTLDLGLQLALAVSAVVGGRPVSVSHHVLRVGTSHKTEVAQMSFVSFMRSAAGRRERSCSSRCSPDRVRMSYALGIAARCRWESWDKRPEAGVKERQRRLALV
jgi:hypothetical protein